MSLLIDVGLNLKLVTFSLRTKFAEKIGFEYYSVELVVLLFNALRFSPENATQYSGVLEVFDFLYFNSNA